MTTPATYNEALAITYLTGQATREQVQEYRQLFANDTTFQKLVQDIEGWLAPLNEETTDLAPPEGLFESLMSEIENETKPDVVNTQISSAAPAAAIVAANDRDTKKWKFIAAAASIVAVLAIGTNFINLGSSTPTPTPNQQLIALLSDDTKPELVAIVYNPASGKVIARLSNIQVPEDGDLQLWLIRETESAPISLGVLERTQGNGFVEFDIPNTLHSHSDVLAVSLEALGGSKSAGPEGPVLFTGAVLN